MDAIDAQLVGDAPMSDPLSLTRVERHAIQGMEAQRRELLARHDEELRQHGEEMLGVLADIAVAHGLPADAFISDWGVAIDAGVIVPLDGTSPAEVLG